MSIAEALSKSDGTIAIHGRVDQGTVVCEQAWSCSGALILVDAAASRSIRLRGEGIGCTGRREPLCCGIDALGKQVIARGTLRRDDRGVWLDGTTLCATQ